MGSTALAEEGKSSEGSHRKAFLAAWLGWTFDGMDGFIYGLVAVPFVTELMGQGATLGEIAAKAGLIQGIFLIGWAIGGAIFGRIGDSLGRARTLTFTICTYAIFTGLSFFSHAWWHLAIFRFLAALGIGGEWAAGSALVAETLPSKHRAWAGALLQSGYITGMILAAFVVGALGQYPPRYVFLVGILPALMTLWIRKAVPEPEEWSGARAGLSLPKYRDLFRAPVLRTTMLTLGMACLTLTSVWALLYFSTQVVRGLPEFKAIANPKLQAQLLQSITITYCLWNIAGNFMAAAIARYVSYRWAMFAMVLGSLICYTVGFGSHRPLSDVRLWLNLTFLFGSGLFALYPLYIPPLFPVLLRTAGAGFCYNFGRIIAGLGTIYLASATAGSLSPNQAIFYAGLLYAPALVIALLMPEAAASRKADLTPEITPA
jgi:MFS family permease